jgi:hypothetical protein
MRLRVVYEDRAGDWFDYWQLSPDALRDAVESTPWTVEQVTGEMLYVATLRLAGWPADRDLVPRPRAGSEISPAGRIGTVSLVTDLTACRPWRRLRLRKNPELPIRTHGGRSHPDP